MIKKKNRWGAFLLCGIMAISIGAAQLIPTIAKPECSCKVEIHGSNCPLSKCTCSQNEHTKDCPLYGAAKELTTCICEPDIHAEGCPRYTAEEVVAEEPETTESESQSTESEVLPEETPVSETIVITFGFMEGVDGTLSFNKVDIPKGEVIGKQIPEISLSDNLKVEGFEVSGTLYDVVALAAYQPQEDTEIIIRTKTADSETLPEDMDDTDRDASLETIPDRVGEEHNQSVLLTAEELQRMNNLADEQVNVIKAALGIHGSIAVKKDEDNLDAVLVLYTVTHGQTENFPYGIKITNQQDRDELQSIYWCMTQITGVSNSKGAGIQVKRLDVVEGAEMLGLSREQTVLAQNLQQEIKHLFS